MMSRRRAQFMNKGVLKRLQAEEKSVLPPPPVPPLCLTSSFSQATVPIVPSFLRDTSSVSSSSGSTQASFGIQKRSFIEEMQQKYVERAQSSSSPSLQATESESETAARLSEARACDLCKIQINSMKMALDHIRGQKHRRALDYVEQPKRPRTSDYVEIERVSYDERNRRRPLDDRRSPPEEERSWAEQQRLREAERRKRLEEEERRRMWKEGRETRLDDRQHWLNEQQEQQRRSKNISDLRSFIQEETRKRMDETRRSGGLSSWDDAEMKRKEEERRRREMDDDRRRQAEEERRKEVEEQRMRHLIDMRMRADEEERRKKLEEEVRRRAVEDRRRQEEKSREEERRREEAKRKEEQRRWEERRREEQKRNEEDRRREEEKRREDQRKWEERREEEKRKEEIRRREEEKWREEQRKLEERREEERRKEEQRRRLVDKLREEERRKEDEKMREEKRLKEEVKRWEEKFKEEERRKEEEKRAEEMRKQEEKRQAEEKRKRMQEKVQERFRLIEQQRLDLEKKKRIQLQEEKRQKRKEELRQWEEARLKGEENRRAMEAELLKTAEEEEKEDLLRAEKQRQGYQPDSKATLKPGEEDRRRKEEEERRMNEGERQRYNEERLRKEDERRRWTEESKRADEIKQARKERRRATQDAKVACLKRQAERLWTEMEEMREKKKRRMEEERRNWVEILNERSKESTMTEKEKLKREAEKIMLEEEEKRKKKLANASNEAETTVPSDAGDDAAEEAAKLLRLRMCLLCDVSILSANVAVAHLKGKKHHEQVIRRVIAEKQAAKERARKAAMKATGESAESAGPSSESAEINMTNVTGDEVTDNVKSIEQNTDEIARGGLSTKSNHMDFEVLEDELVDEEMETDGETNGLSTADSEVDFSHAGDKPGDPIVLDEFEEKDEPEGGDSQSLRPSVPGHISLKRQVTALAANNHCDLCQVPIPDLRSAVEHCISKQHQDKLMPSPQSDSTGQNRIVPPTSAFVAGSRVLFRPKMKHLVAAQGCWLCNVPLTDNKSAMAHLACKTHFSNVFKSQREEVEKRKTLCQELEEKKAETTKSSEEQSSRFDAEIKRLVNQKGCTDCGVQILTDMAAIHHLISRKHRISISGVDDLADKKSERTKLYALTTLSPKNLEQATKSPPRQRESRAQIIARSVSLRKEECVSHESDRSVKKSSLERESVRNEDSQMTERLPVERSAPIATEKPSLAATTARAAATSPTKEPTVMTAASAVEDDPSSVRKCAIEKPVPDPRLPATDNVLALPNIYRACAPLLQLFTSNTETGGSEAPNTSAEEPVQEPTDVLPASEIEDATKVALEEAEAEAETVVEAPAPVEEFFETPKKIAVAPPKPVIPEKPVPLVGLPVLGDLAPSTPVKRSAPVLRLATPTAAHTPPGTAKSETTRGFAKDVRNSTAPMLQSETDTFVQGKAKENLDSRCIRASESGKETTETPGMDFP